MLQIEDRFETQTVESNGHDGEQKVAEFDGLLDSIVDEIDNLAASSHRLSCLIRKQLPAWARADDDLVRLVLRLNARVRVLLISRDALVRWRLG